MQPFLRLLALSLLLFTARAHADDMKAYELKSCNIWIPAHTGSGFLCAAMPTNILVPEAHSFATEIRRLQQTIHDLEIRVEQLEKNQK